ncbi:MAG: hypothetical protein ACUVSB_12325 [Anaerolineae bacterium]
MSFWNRWVTCCLKKRLRPVLRQIVREILAAKMLLVAVISRTICSEADKRWVIAGYLTYDNDATTIHSEDKRCLERIELCGTFDIIPPYICLRAHVS